MTWPARVQTILNTFAALHPTWVADDSGPAPTPRDRLNHLFVEQVRFELGPAYGFKRSSTTAPISSENLALSLMNGALIAWAWENTHDGRVAQFPESDDISGQTFVTATPIDHLGGQPPVPLPIPPLSPPVTPPYPGDQIGTQIGTPLFADFLTAAQGPNTGMGVWFWRTAWDTALGEPVEGAIARHRLEWRQALNVWRTSVGLPPIAWS